MADNTELTMLNGMRDIIDDLDGEIAPEKLTTLNGIQKIIELIEEGGGGLPEVDSTDNGKVLTVIDGAWAAGSGGGGGGGYLIVKADGEITQESAPDNMIVYTCGVDHTAEEITNAYKSFIPVYFYIPRLSGGGYTDGAFHVFLLDNSLLEGDFNTGTEGESCGYYYDDGDFYMYQAVKNMG